MDFPSHEWVPIYYKISSSYPFKGLYVKANYKTDIKNSLRGMWKNKMEKKVFVKLLFNILIQYL